MSAFTSANVDKILALKAHQCGAKGGVDERLESQASGAGHGHHVGAVISSRHRRCRTRPGFKLPDPINWKENATAGNANAVLYGDPSKPGLYIVLVKWHAGHMSHPHFHPNDRFITVISGTWWVGTGTKFDREATVPMPAGSFVTHFGKQVHYDGAKGPSRDKRAIWAMGIW